MLFKPISAGCIIWKLQGYALGRWGLWPYEGGVRIWVFQHLVFGIIRRWVTKNKLIWPKAKNWLFCSENISLENGWEIKNFTTLLWSCPPCDKFFFFFVNQVFKITSLVIDLARSLKYFDDVKLYSRRWWASSLLKIHETF